ncbi:MAG: S41 family peptidase [Phycisphaerales bacterium]|nr:S41 family peptidase [Phycisphaerales bacterium]
MSRRPSVWICLVLIIAAMFYGLTPMAAEQDSVYRTYAPLIEVDTLVHRHYVRPLRDGTLVDGAIRGMLSELDPYSGYVASHEMESFRRRNTGEFTGIGVELGLVGASITVIAPFEHGPAMLAGIESGDEIVAVDARPVDDLSLFDVEGLLDGPPGTQVNLTVRRSGKPIELTIPRERVQRPAVEGFAREENGRWVYWADTAARIGYVRVSQFGRGMMDDFDRVLNDLLRSDVRGLIIDLRFNAGGLMTQAVAMVDRFVTSGVILTTVNRSEGSHTYLAGDAGTVRDLPLVILVNAGSASSSEIVAGALQDHHRAVIVGERTFGKGTVQDFIHVQDGRAGVRLTVAHYQLPGGRMIHKQPGADDSDSWGIIPDRLVPITGDQRARNSRSRSDRTIGSDAAEPRIDPQLDAALSAVRDSISSTSPNTP